ncbi:hypothetical protein ACHAPO_011281 [Fusarium lateritium]
MKPYFPDEQKVGVYIKAFNEAFGMFKPAWLTFKPESLYECETVHDETRLPFSNVSTIRTANDGFATIQKVGIYEEYQDGSIKDLINKYPYSTEGIGKQKRFIFAIKSIMLKGAPYANEVEILSRFTESKNDNVIPLLTCYVWRDHVYLVFPYIETTLHDILHGARPDASLKVSETNPLPKNWLWQEMIRISNTLAFMHTGISIPVAGQVTNVKVAHYDLKPDNVLVAGKNLKLIDFGHCLLRLDNENGIERPQTTQGHPVYAPPETVGIMTEWVGQHSQDVGDLNYDVWSLACVMVEVLIHICDIKGPQEDKTPIAQFEGAIKSNPMNQRFYNENLTVKDCVKDILADIKRHFSNNEAHLSYVASVITLLHEMFDGNPCDRLSSPQVTKRLKAIGSEFKKTYKYDALATRVSKYQPEGYVEVAWKFESESAIGFTTM